MLRFNAKVTQLALSVSHDEVVAHVAVQEADASDPGDRADLFEIVLDFSTPSSAIEDVSQDVFEHDHTYRAFVLAHFTDTFIQRLYEHEQTGSDADLEPFEFAFTI